VDDLDPQTPILTFDSLINGANRDLGEYTYVLEAGFSQVSKNCYVFCQTVGGVFLTFLPKIKDGNSIW
jgi:hypothetical protein